MILPESLLKIKKKKTKNTKGELKIQEQTVITEKKSRKTWTYRVPKNHENQEKQRKVKKK